MSGPSRQPGPPRRGFWLDQALAREEQRQRRPLSAAITADVCIVGGGYTGLWTAIELKSRHPGLDVVLVEARSCGSGASGTNAGYLMNLWPKFGSLQALAGRDHATWLARQSSAAVEDIITFCARHQIDAQAERGGWLWASTSAVQDRAWAETLALVASLDGAPLEALAPDAAQELGGAGVRQAVWDPTAATLQPAALARGLRAVAAGSYGIRLFEHTPARAVTERGARALVSTPSGSVAAGAVVLATNAWLSAHPAIRRHLLITASDNAVTPELPAAAAAAAARPGVGVSDSTRLLNYWRLTPGGRVLFGKGGVGLGFGGRGADSLFGPVPRPGVLRREFDRVLPALAGIVFETTWRAPVEYSPTSLPFFGTLPGRRRVYYGTGYSGDGVGPSRLGGRILASLALGSDDEWSQCAFTRPPRGWLPPEPIRFLGGQLVKTALLRKERAENAGRRPGPVTASLSRLDPTAFV